MREDPVDQNTRNVNYFAETIEVLDGWYNAKLTPNNIDFVDSLEKICDTIQIPPESMYPGSCLLIYGQMIR